MGNGELFLEELFLEKAAVVAVARQQFFVGAEFGNASANQDRDAIGVAHGGYAVGDEDGSATGHHAAEFLQNALLRVGVDAGEGVVEDEDAGVTQDGARQRSALFLAAG